MGRGGGIVPYAPAIMAPVKPLELPMKPGQGASARAPTAVGRTITSPASRFSWDATSLSVRFLASIYEFMNPHRIWKSSAWPPIDQR